jgi:hypothetical protein
MLARVNGSPHDDVERYAELSAALAGAQDRAALLAAHGLDEDAWAALDARWQHRLSAELASAEGLPPLVTRHAEAFARALRAAGAPVPLALFVEATVVVQRGGDVGAGLSRLGLDVGRYLAASRWFSAQAASDPAMANQLADALARAVSRATAR